MPGGNGVELAGRLTARRPTLNVLFMSGYTDDAAIRNGMLAGEAAFIQKPFTPHELLRKVKQVLDVGACGSGSGSWQSEARSPSPEPEAG